MDMDDDDDHDATFCRMMELVSSNRTEKELEWELQYLKIPGLVTKANALSWLHKNLPCGVSRIIEFHCCPNDHLLFYKDFAKDTRCKVCNAARYRKDGKTPVRVYPYIPLADRFRRFYKSLEWSKKFDHQFKRTSKDGYFTDIADGELFKNITTSIPFSKYTPPLFFGVDGITMDGKKTKTLEPLALVNLFLPPHERTKSAYHILSGLLPENASNVKVFMQPLLDEIAEGFNVQDACDGKWHRCKPILLFGVFDTRGLPKITLGNQTPSKYACHVCHHKGIWSKVAHTTVYPGHFSFCCSEAEEIRKDSFKTLPLNHEAKAFTDEPPALRTQEELVAAGKLADAATVLPDKPNHPCKIHFQQHSTYIDQYFPYWCGRDCVCYDPMHAFMNKGINIYIYIYTY